MSDSHEEVIELLNLQIGCILRYGRLKLRLSQLQLGLEVGMSDIMIGRIERALNFSSWDKIYLFGKYVNIPAEELFSIKTRDELLEIVQKSYELEPKKSPSTKLYYENLKGVVKQKFS